jgi:hypothetical protein
MTQELGSERASHLRCENDPGIPFISPLQEAYGRLLGIDAGLESLGEFRVGQPRCPSSGEAKESLTTNHHAG